MLPIRLYSSNQLPISLNFDNRGVEASILNSNIALLTSNLFVQKFFEIWLPNIQFSRISISIFTISVKFNENAVTSYT